MISTPPNGKFTSREPTPRKSPGNSSSKHSGEKVRKGLDFDTPVQFLKGVGPKLGDLFASRGVVTVSDLLEWYPRAYEDRRSAKSIDSLEEDQVVSLRAQILGIRTIPLGKTHRKLYEVLIGDATGKVSCKFFRVPFRGYFERFELYQKVRVSGKVIRYQGRIEFHHPDLAPLEDPDQLTADELRPIYTETEGLKPGKLKSLIALALEELKVSEKLASTEAFPVWMRQKFDLILRLDALRSIHIPEIARAEQYQNFKSPAHRRLIFEEFFWLELFVLGQKKGYQQEISVPFPTLTEKIQSLISTLPFALTQGQTHALDEIFADLAHSKPMHRLLQGDVGCGKTLVALLSAYQVILHKSQAAIMVPTEILSEQHFKNAKKFFADFGVRVQLLTASIKGADRQKILDDLKLGDIDLLVGTHALIEDPVQFRNLGLVIVDEQHRFGVRQRQRLKEKGISPHFLIMTATPIPRTLAMTVYGDLDVSSIRELPPGRSPITTRKTFESKRKQVYDFIREHLSAGRQAYVVYPLVEESEKLELKNVTDGFVQLQLEFPNFQVGLLHGKMKPLEKEEVMNRFRTNEIQVLAATTVIEVGVDVPNANIMLIEHTERFGLSQLHQLRGRVGRGAHKSFCILMLGHAISEEAIHRAEIMEQTTDGFKVSEADLEIRGPGEFFGRRQSGLPGFKLANLLRDTELLQEARKAAQELLSLDPDLKKSEHQLLKERSIAASEALIG